ncbi:hypothetical protein [Modestobacter lapidis]|nr:hypothetical protein [Modestobacter lapidis]
MLRKTMIVVSAIGLVLGATATSALADHSQGHRIEQAQADLATANETHAAAQQAVLDAEAAVPVAQAAADEAAYGARTDAQHQQELTTLNAFLGIMNQGCSFGAAGAQCRADNLAWMGPGIDRERAFLAIPYAQRLANNTAAQAALTQAKADLAAAQTAVTAAAAAVTAAEAVLAEAQAAVPLPREKDVLATDGFAVEGLAVPPTFAPAATVVVADCTDEGIAFTVTTDNTGSTDGTNAGAGTVSFTTATGSDSVTADLAAGQETTSDSRLVAFDEVVAVSVEATVDGVVQELAQRTIAPSSDCDSAVGITVAGPTELEVGKSGVYTVNVTNSRGDHDTPVQIGLEVEAFEDELQTGDVTLEACDTAACDTAAPLEFEVTDGVLHVTQDGLMVDHGADVDRFLRLTFASNGAYVGTVYAIDSGLAV